MYEEGNYYVHRSHVKGMEGSIPFTSKEGKFR